MGPKDRLRRHPGAIRNGELGGGARNGSPRTATRITSVCTASRSGWLRRWPEYVQKWRPGELGFAGEEARDPEAIIAQGHRGSRYSFGHPACPNLADQKQLLALLRAEEIGITLSEEDQLDPEQSTSAIVLHHPRRSTSRFSAEGRASCFSSEVPERAPLTDSDQQSSFAKSGSISAGSRRTAAIAAEGTDGCWAPGGPRQNNVARAPADFCVP